MKVAAVVVMFESWSGWGRKVVMGRQARVEGRRSSMLH